MALICSFTLILLCVVIAVCFVRREPSMAEEAELLRKYYVLKDDADTRGERYPPEEWKTGSLEGDYWTLKCAGGNR